MARERWLENAVSWERRRDKALEEAMSAEAAGMPWFAEHCLDVASAAERMIVKALDWAEREVGRT